MVAVGPRSSLTENSVERSVSDGIALPQIIGRTHDDQYFYHSEKTKANGVKRLRDQTKLFQDDFDDEDITKIDRL